MKNLLLLVVCLFSLHTTFSQTSKIYDIKPLPANITQSYVDGSVNRHIIKFIKDKRNVQIYINDYYVTTEKIKPLKEYCKKLLDFHSPNKGMIIQTDDSRGKSSTLIGRLNDRIDVISIRVTTEHTGNIPMVMSISRLETVLAALESI